MALGGGCEILLHSDAIQAHAESYIGLVEVGVGLIPGWGGCKELLARWQANSKAPKGPMPAVAKVFEYISHRAGGEVRRRSPGNADFARTRRHHHEPQPPAVRRQGKRR